MKIIKKETKTVFEKTAESGDHGEDNGNFSSNNSVFFETLISLYFFTFLNRFVLILVKIPLKDFGKFRA